METDMQVMIISVALLTVKNVSTTVNPLLPTPGILPFFLYVISPTVQLYMSCFKTVAFQMYEEKKGEEICIHTLFYNYTNAFASTLGWKN